MGEWWEMCLGDLTNNGQVNRYLDLSYSLGLLPLQRELDTLPDHLHGLQSVLPPYPVTFSEQLQADLDAIRRQLGFEGT